MEKISVCLTVLNEEKHTFSLLSALSKQTIKPFEIIVVDGGSNDTTLDIISFFIKKNKKIKLLKAPGTTISQARNMGIELSRGEIIATTDFGCVPKIDWLEKITQPFIHSDIGMVAGFYNMIYKTPLQRVSSVYLGVPPKKFDNENFIPSARSVAFRKRVWEDVEGFDEKFEKGGEDTDFFYKCVKRNVKIIRIKEARVDWIEIKEMGYKDIVKKFFVYAKGDGQANIWWHPAKQFSSHNIKISMVYLRYIVFIILLYFSLSGAINYLIFVILFIGYILWPIFKWREIIKETSDRLLIPFIQISADIYVMKGFFLGILKK